MKMKSLLRRNWLLIATVTSIVLGVVIGFVCRQFNPSDDVILLVGFPGDLFLRMLKMLMLPLIISSIITGVGNLKGASAGRMGVVSLLYYSSTTIIALLIGLTMALTMRPGARSNQGKSTDKSNSQNSKISGMDIFLDLLRNLLPANILAATTKYERTVSNSEQEENVGNNISLLLNISENPTLNTIKETRLFDGANIIGVLLYCVVFGVILSRMGRQGRVVTKLFTAVNEITLQMIKLVMWYSPVGIMFLISSQVISSEDLSKTGKTLGMYIAAELTALFIHFLLAMPLFYFILTRGNAYKVYLGALQALVTAFATSSSAATLPVTVQCLEQNLKMDPRIVGFILPIGMTVNMDGGAVFGVQDAWLDAMNHCPDVLQADAFNDYIVATWVDDDARFPPRLWNHHGTQGPRTNNNLEGFHSRIGKTLQHRHPNVYRFIELIKNIENGEKAKVIQINFGAAPPPKKAIYKEKEQRLSRLKDQLRRGEKSPMQFLDAVGPLMMMKM